MWLCKCSDMTQQISEHFMYQKAPYRLVKKESCIGICKRVHILKSSRTTFLFLGTVVDRNHCLKISDNCTDTVSHTHSAESHPSSTFSKWFWQTGIRWQDICTKDAQRHASCYCYRCHTLNYSVRDKSVCVSECLCACLPLREAKSDKASMRHQWQTHTRTHSLRLGDSERGSPWGKNTHWGRLTRRLSYHGIRSGLWETVPSGHGHTHACTRVCIPTHKHSHTLRHKAAQGM